MKSHKPDFVSETIIFKVISADSAFSPLEGKNLPTTRIKNLENAIRKVLTCYLPKRFLVFKNLPAKIFYFQLSEYAKIFSLAALAIFFLINLFFICNK